MTRIVIALASMLAATTAHARSLEVVGTGDGMELVRAIGAAFTADHPDTPVIVPPSIGSGGGIAAVGAGKAPLARVARGLKPEEVASGLEQKPVFRLPTAIYVQGDLAVNSITFRELVDIYSGRVTNWKEVGGPDKRVKVVRREDTDSSLAVLRASMPGWDKLEFTSRSKTAVTTQEAVETVRVVPGAIGFGPFSRQLEASVKVLRINGLYPTDPDYPSSVTVSYVWRKSDLPETAKAFIDYGSSEKALGLLAAMGAVPVNSVTPVPSN